MASFIGSRRSNDRFVGIKNHSFYFRLSKRDCSGLKGACQRRADTGQPVINQWKRDCSGLKGACQWRADTGQPVISFQRSGTSRLGVKGERRNRQTQGSTRHVHYLRKVPTIKKFAVHLLFSESHTVFSVLLFCGCSFNCLICITCFWVLVLALGSPEWRQEQGTGLGLFTDVALALARLFQTETILFEWMKIETRRLPFG